MSKLEDLINKLCPNGVPFKHLWEITTWDKKFNGSTKSMQPHVKKFKHISAKELKSLAVADGDIKLLSTGNFDAYTSVNLAGEYINDDEIIAIPSGGSPIVKYYYGKFVDSGNILAVSSNKNDYNLKYIYYYLINNLDFLETCYRGSGIKHPDMLKVLNFTLPVPPIEVQREIVRILDNFTELTEELTEELTARKKQYEYYRDKLIGNKNYQRKKLGEIATEMFRGNGIKRDEVTEIGIPCIRYGEIYTSYGIYFDKCISYTREDVISNPKILKKYDVLFAITGESIEEIAKTTCYLGDEEGYVGGDIVVMRHNQNAKYISYALSTIDAIKQKGMGKVKSKVVHTNIPSLKEIIIPLPSLEEQQRIVDILDKFNAYCNDIMAGIPAEIEARQKQYEYYRDKLLTFKKLEV